MTISSSHTSSWMCFESGFIQRLGNVLRPSAACVGSASEEHRQRTVTLSRRVTHALTTPCALSCPLSSIFRDDRDCPTAHDGWRRVRRQKSYGVKVTTPITRPTQSFTTRRWKNDPSFSLSPLRERSTSLLHVAYFLGPLGLNVFECPKSWRSETGSRDPAGWGIRVRESR
jgi:hypothetical protein